MTTFAKILVWKTRNMKLHRNTSVLLFSLELGGL
jgi:hypothetical protein